MRHLNTISFLSCFLLLFAEPLHAKQYYFRRLQVENGLSNNTVFCSAQDKTGFMWFGTRDGLNRFDGYTFKVFRNNPQDPNSIGSSYIHSLYADDDGSLLVGTKKGLYRYNAVNESFRLIDISAQKDTRDIKKDREGNLWLILGLQLCKYNPVTKQAKQYTAFKNATSICITTNGTIWISCTNGKIARYNAATDDFILYDVFTHSKPVASKWVEKIYEGNNQTLLIGTSNQGIKIFDRQTNNYKDALTYNADNTEMYVRDFMQYAPGEYWVATESGIYIFHEQSGRFTNLQKDYNNSYSLSDNAIYTLCKDREGGMWAGTYFGGVNYYPKPNTYFEKFLPNNYGNSLRGNAIREICADDYGNLWIGTEDAGLNKYNTKTGQFSWFRPSGKKGDIAYSNIHGLLATGQQLWIGTFERGLDIMDIASGKVVKHYAAVNRPGAFKSNFIITIYRLQSGTIFIGTGSGLYEYDAAKDAFTLVEDVAPDDFIYALCEDHNGILWVGSENNGVFRYDPLQHIVRMLRIGSDKINGIFEDSRHQLWFCTEGGGLCQVDPSTNAIRRYTTANGLSSNFIFRVLEDAHGNIWASTSKGLACIHPKTGEIKMYNKEDGLLSDQFNYNSAYKDARGNMYFGSVKGMISFNPDSFTVNSFSPPLFITGFQVHNKDRAIPYKERLALQYDQSSFSIDFAALSYTSPEKTSYAYMMEGLDKNWTYLTTNRRVYFTELPPGNYVFRVKASVDGVAYGQEEQLTIQIKPPFWLSVPAYLLYVLVAGLIAYWLIHSYHLHHLEKNKRKLELMEHEKEKEIYQAKIDFFTNVTHEVRTPLTLIKGPVEDMMLAYGHVPELKKSLGIVEKNTNRLIELTNQLLDFRQTESAGFSLRFSEADVNALFTEICAQFIPVAKQKSLDYAIDVPTAPLIAWIDVEACRKILGNLVNNAVKYAQHKVHLELEAPQPQDLQFRIIIRNDGYLIPCELKEKIFEAFYRIPETNSQKGTGIGLAIARSLTTLHKGTLVLQCDDKTMNTFVLTLPLRQ